MPIIRHETNSRMSQIVVYNNIAYLSGQVGVPGGDITQQTKDVLGEIDRLLASVDTNKTKLLTAMIWLKDMKDFAAMNEVWEEWVPEGHAPTRATGKAELAGPEYLVEIIVTAAIE